MSTCVFSRFEISRLEVFKIYRNLVKVVFVVLLLFQFHLMFLWCHLRLFYRAPHLYCPLTSIPVHSFHPLISLILSLVQFVFKYSLSISLCQVTCCVSSILFVSSYVFRIPSKTLSIHLPACRLLHLVQHDNFISKKQTFTLSEQHVFL